MTMQYYERSVAVIHARGGSKRIPLKNLAQIGGHPLIWYPIKLCQRLPWVERIIVSTDHDGIMDAAREAGAEVPFRRPADISEDVPSELVTEHALRALESSGYVLPKYTLTLTPATPFTSPATVEDAFALICANLTWDSVTTVRRVREYPEWIFRRNEETGEMRTILGNPLDGEFNVSQNLPPAYYPTGAFWINNTRSFLAKPGLYGERWGAIMQRAEEALDIDWPEDLSEAKKRASV